MQLILRYSFPTFVTLRRNTVFLILLSCVLSSCSSSPPAFACLCDIPPVPNLPSNEALSYEIQKEELAAKQGALAR